MPTPRSKTHRALPEILIAGPASGHPCSNDQQFYATRIKQLVVILLCAWLLAVSSACGNNTAISIRTGSSTSSTFTVSGPSQIRANQTAIFSAFQDDHRLGSVIWSVNGMVGGDVTVGTITSDGLYRAPETPSKVSISCMSSVAPSISASTSLEILNPEPVVSSATVIGNDEVGTLIDVIGTGFVSQSLVSVDGSLTSTEFVSSSHLRAAISSLAGNASSAVLDVNNPEPGALTSNAKRVAIPGGPISQFIGCSNPNVSTSVGDWGSPASAMYVPVTLTSPVLGTPDYDSNTVFWTSRETGPGESVLMTGAFTKNKKTAKVALIPAGTVDWKSVVRQGGEAVITTQQGTTGLSFRVPSQFPPGVYGYEIDDSQAPPVFGMANVPSIQWAMGVPSQTDAKAALQSRVHDCGAEPGQTLRIFGKNILQSSKVVLESADGTIISISPNKQDNNSLSAKLPDSLLPGNYFAWIGEIPWSATSSEVRIISVTSPQNVTTSNVACRSLVGDGETDNSAPLQSCLDENAPQDPSKQLVYISLPKGTFELYKGIKVRSGEILIGLSPTETEIVGRSIENQPEAWVTVTPFTGIANLSITAPNATHLVSGSDLTGTPEASGHVFIKNVNFDSTPSGSNRATWGMVALSGSDIQVYHSTFRSGTMEGLGVFRGDGGVISGNTFINNTSLNGFYSSQNLIIENNTVSSDYGPGTNGTAAFYFAREFCVMCAPRVTRNEYIGYNTIHDMGAPDNQIISTDGGAGAYYGQVASSTRDTLVLANDPTWIRTGRGNLEGIDVAIIFGTGVGQHSFIKSVNGKIVTVQSPWKVLPDATSLVVICASESNWIVSHNSITNTLGQAVLLARSVDAVIEDNVITNSGQGILLWGVGPYGTPEEYRPIMDTELLRNRIEAGTGDLVIPSQNSNLAGIGILDCPGIAISGLLIRGNSVTKRQSIYSTNGINGINANLIEGNRAVWVGPEFSWPQFLVRDNDLPPDTN